MTQIIEFALLGLATGALIAGLAVSILLSFRGSGVVNLATGVIAVLGAYVFYDLRTNGALFLPPIPFAPHELKLGGPWGTVPAILAAIAVCALTGVFSELLVWRPLRHAAPLARLLASLGIFLTIQTVLTMRFGNQGQLEPPVFPGLANPTINVFGAHVAPIQFALLGIVVLVGGGLAAVFRFTRFGLATRAAQEDEANAVLWALSPPRLSMVNTVMGAVVAGALGVLVASQTQLDPTTIPLTVIPALGAALIARFTSFPVAVLAGVGLGVLESELTWLQSLSWFPTDLNHQPLPGLSDLLFFLIIAAAMLWRGEALPQRGSLVEKRLPAAPVARRLALPAGGASAVLLIALLVLPYAYRQALINTLIGTLVCLSLVVITGFVGQVSLLQVALAGVSGFVVSKLAVTAGIGFPIGPLLACVVATVVGTVCALPALRVRGVTLAILTLAGAQALDSFWFTNARWGGGVGVLNVPQPHLFGLNLGTTASFPINAGVPPSPVFGLMCAAFAVLAGLLVASLRRSHLGQRMLAVRSNERAAASAGISVSGVKLSAFGISSMIAGLAGALYAYNFGSVSSSQFDVLGSLAVIAYAFVGGITTVKGAVLGGLGVTGGLLGQVLNNQIGIPANYQLLIGGVGLVLIIVQNPGGLAAAPPPRQAIASLVRRVRGKRALTDSSIDQHRTASGPSEAGPDVNAERVVEVTK